MLRRPVSPEAAAHEGSGIVAVSQRKRSAFLSGRVQRLGAYLVWSHDPRLRAVADGPTSGRASRLRQWWKRRRASAPTYLGSEIEAAAARFPLDGGRGPGPRSGAHTDRDALARRGVPAPLRADQPSGHDLGRRDGKRYELAARPLGTRGGAQSPAPRRRARDPVLAPLSARPSLREPAPGALLPWMRR